MFVAAKKLLKKNNNQKTAGSRKDRRVWGTLLWKARQDLGRKGDTLDVNRTIKCPGEDQRLKVVLHQSISGDRRTEFKLKTLKCSLFIDS